MMSMKLAILAVVLVGLQSLVFLVLRNKQRVIVEGAHMIKRHVRKNQQNPNGAIVEREGTVHISNVMKADAFDASPRRQKATPAKAE